MKRGDVEITREGHVAILEIQRPPNNFFSTQLINDLGDTLEALDEDAACRASVLCSQGKHFCAGRDFTERDPADEGSGRREGRGSPLYAAAVRLFACRKPVVGAIQGAAVGGGFGLALMPDFRVVCPEARFAANFVKLGIHQGFGISVTLPRLIGQQEAANMLLTGRRVNGEEALELGLVDRLVDIDDLRDAASELASEIAENAPLAVMSVRATLRDGLAEAVRKATDHELKEQQWLRATNDAYEGIKAVAERRAGHFTGT